MSLLERNFKELEVDYGNSPARDIEKNVNRALCSDF